MTDAPIYADFARQHPQAFAAELGAMSVEDVTAVLATLPDDCVTGVIVHLPLSTADPILAGADEARVADWLSAGTLGDAVRLLARMERGRRRTLLAAMDDDVTRDTLNRMINFPSQSVGALVDVNVTWVSDSARIDEAVEILRSDTARGDRPIVVLDADGRVQGFLNTTRALQLAPDHPVSDCVVKTVNLRAETSIPAAIDVPAWSQHTWLPVVDRDRRLIGVVTRARLLASTEAERAESAGEPILGGVAAGLVELLPPVLSDLVDLAIGKRPE